jgi:hypothetical protein
VCLRTIKAPIIGATVFVAYGSASTTHDVAAKGITILLKSVMKVLSGH